MRETAHRVLGPDNAPDALPSADEELETLTATLRGHLELLLPEVEQAAGRLPENSVTRYGAMYCVGEARGKRRAPELSFAPLAGSMYARRLARVLATLCCHYEIVSAGIEMTSEQQAFEHLADHCLRCPTCRAVDDEGMHAGLPCEEENRLYEAYRAARARAVAARLARRHAAEVSA
ncbi:DUF6415 family natural product biosynthesis protein [Streptomyces sp. Go-475]|uniref:DUF6415 family natural product biosynthesis protein n=1 Tax=Streptomyces sp. Go-475 TaxID=2072505 RepID=UPI000DEEEEAA|nr:DUF6415 family natural product biosynthesis protein [Streptomyces sp. Go-475]